MNKTSFPVLPANSVDRSSLYKQVIGLGEQGKSHAQIARKLKINRATLKAWMEQDSGFAAAMQEADDLALAWWEAQLQAQAQNRSGNASLIMFVMKNRFETDYGKDALAETPQSVDTSVVKDLSPNVRAKLRKLLQAEQAGDG